MTCWPRLSLASVLPIAALASACQPEASNQAETSPPDIANDIAADLPVRTPEMDRAGLLMAVARAGSAMALGQDDAAEQRQLGGRRVEIRIRFGCANSRRPPAGASSAAVPFTVSFNETDRTLRVRAKPDLTGQEPWVASLGGDRVEAVEGFWIYRPWLLADGCPAPNPVSSPPAPDGQADATTPANPSAARPRLRLGIAHFYTKDDPRVGRRDNRSFEATKVLAEGDAPSPDGYNLVLAGRLAQLPTGRVIICRAITPDLPPECVVSAVIDHVRIEQPGSKALLAEWSL